MTFSLVTVHPLVLLSVVDHYNRIIGASDRSKRVAGVLLGQVLANGATVNVSNSYAVPFEEDEKNPNVWFLDHHYHEAMNDLFKKVNAKERIVGWYHTGPKLKASDLQINELFKKYTPQPVLVVIDVEPKSLGLPTESYVAVEETHADGSPSSWTFAHLPCAIEAEESEEIGVEHLLRDIRDHSMLAAVSSNSGSKGSLNSSDSGSQAPLSARISNTLNSLISFSAQLTSIASYLRRVAAGSLPVNHQINALLQDIFNLLPDLAGSPSWQRAATIENNDAMALVYLGSLLRSVLALHRLIDNKLENREEEKKLDESIASAAVNA